MEYDSSESMRSVERADVPRPSTDGVRLTAARRRRLQRRRAAEAQRASAAAIAAAATAVTEVSDREETTRRVESRPAVCRSIRAMDIWPEFDQLVVGPSEVVCRGSDRGGLHTTSTSGEVRCRDSGCVVGDGCGSLMCCGRKDCRSSR